MNGFDREDDREAALRVLAPMREGPLAVAGRLEQEEALRARVLHNLRDQVIDVPATLRARARRRLVIASLGGASLLAAAAAGVLAFVAQRTPSVVANAPQEPPRAALSVEAIEGAGGADAVAAAWIDASGHSHALATRALPAGALELQSNDTSPRLRTSQGVQVTLSASSRLRVRSLGTGDGPELRLLAGEVSCAVPKLGATRQFAIDAPGARVIVHGTRFTVRATGSKTCVRVSEGVVSVHPEANDAEVKRLGPGEQWGCEPERKAAEPPSAARTAKTRTRPSRAAELEPREPEAPSGTLDAENRLLAEALRAERRNERSRARRLFAELLREHPSSPLALEASKGLERTRD